MPIPQRTLQSKQHSLLHIVEHCIINLMPNTDKRKYTAYMRAYMLKRYHERRTRAVTLLGGVCVVCGESHDLEIDHIDRKEKSFSISKLWSGREDRFLKELKKCQLLCRKHHQQKSIKERGWNSRSSHGTVAAYTHGKCRCEKCKKAKRKQMREYRKSRDGRVP